MNRKTFILHDGNNSFMVEVWQCDDGEPMIKFKSEYESGTAEYYYSCKLSDLDKLGKMLLLASEEYKDFNPDKVNYN